MAPAASPSTLGALLAARAGEDPHATFMVWEGREFSRGWLYDRASRYADACVRRGLQPGERVALMLGNGPEFVIAFFGNALAGLVTVPVNVLLRGPEVAYQLEKTGAAMMIYGPAFVETVAQVRKSPSVRIWLSAGKPPFRDDTFFSLLTDLESTGRFEDRARPDDVAAILFTSGTTGSPKGAMLSHANYLANAEQLGEFVEMGPEDRPLCVLPLFHVNGQVVTLVTPLWSRASMALLRGFSREAFLGQVAEARATSFSAVPTIYSVLLTLPDRDQYDLSSLRYCICGAAPMPVEVFERFEREFKAKIVEGYGLTEGTCASCVNPVQGPRKVGTIGIPLPGQEMRLVDGDGGEVTESGAVGEIVIRGPNVMLGYYQDPDATAATIRHGWLHSGDLGTKDEDGYFSIVGRKKEMIIRGGENIYPKELEEAIYQDERVLEAAVVGIPDPVWGEEVALFLVTKPGRELDEESVKSHLDQRLADFKRPRYILFRESLPKTATGKIRKGELRDGFLATR